MNASLAERPRDRPSLPTAPIWRMAVRPTLLFVAAYMLTMTSHEVIHAVVAYRLGFSSTVFHLWVTPDSAHATPTQVAVIAAAGPIFSLVVGAIGWISYKRRPEGPSALVLLLLGIIGTYAFLGPIVGAALGGDVNTALRALGMPAAVGYALSAAGAIALAMFMFFCGKQLVRATPAGTSRARAVIATVIAPWLIGTLLSVVLYLPLPSVLILSSLTGSAFWLFAAIGAFFARDTPRQPATLAVRYADLGLVVAALLMVRVLVSGVRLAP